MFGPAPAEAAAEAGLAVEIAEPSEVGWAGALGLAVHLTGNEVGKVAGKVRCH